MCEKKNGVKILSGAIVVDTDILIDAGHDIEVALSVLELYEHNTNLSVSVITKMELVVGCRNKHELRYMEKFLYRFLVLNVSEDISTKADNLLLKYRLSHGLLIPDALIAATAISWNSPLISKNQRDYRFIEGLNLEPYP
jgi:predicted nucleic acid-binding protein